MQHLISICIPAYKRTDYLKRLLDSISQQSFSDFEVIVTDDSPDEQVAQFCAGYSAKYELLYFRNEKQLGTPENWNEGIRRSTGKWIKLMHDDDWFTDAGSLARFAKVINEQPNASFIFSAYQNIFLDENRTQPMHLHRFRLNRLLDNPATLFSQNVIGPPSVIMHRNDGLLFYDNKLKWVVDIEFYIRYFKTARPVYIPEVCINVGIGSEQVTRDCFLQRPVEIPENFYLLNKVGESNLKNVLVYDAWWRLMRNLEIKSTADIPASGYHGKIPAAIQSMISWQKRLPKSLLNAGISSKFFMFFNYLSNLGTK